jgi:GAF domain-containing protein
MLSASDLKIILRISTAITSAPDLDTILSKACEAAVELFGVSHSALVLFDNAFECGMVRAEHLQLESRGEKIRLRVTPSGEQLIQSKLLLIIPDMPNGISFLDSVGNVLLKLAFPRPCLCQSRSRIRSLVHSS